MEKLKDFDDLVKAADRLVDNYDGEGNAEAINDYAWGIYEVTGWCVANYVNAYQTSRGVVDDDLHYGDEKAACLEWLRTDVEDRLLREYVF